MHRINLVLEMRFDSVRNFEAILVADIPEKKS